MIDVIRDKVTEALKLELVISLRRGRWRFHDGGNHTDARFLSTCFNTGNLSQASRKLLGGSGSLR